MKHPARRAGKAGNRPLGSKMGKTTHKGSYRGLQAIFRGIQKTLKYLKMSHGTGVGHGVGQPTHVPVGTCPQIKSKSKSKKQR